MTRFALILFLSACMTGLGLARETVSPESAPAPPMPAYVKPSLFQDKEASVGSAEWVLPATISMPVGDGPFPAVVLVHGSGPNDRDGTIGPNKPLKDLAWGLASSGIVALRYEKRTKQYAARMAGLASLTVKEETVDDALSAVKLLQAMPGVDPKRIFVLGHSLGGMLVPRIGWLDPDVAGFIVLAGPTRPLEDVVVDQIAYLNALGVDSEAATDQLASMEAQAARIKTLDPLSAEPAELIMGARAAYWIDLRGYRPADLARELRQPMLILQGERDYQVTLADFRIWKEALADRQNVVFKTYADLNHLFMTGKGKATPAEYGKQGHMAKVVVDDIAAWIRK